MFVTKYYHIMIYYGFLLIFIFGNCGLFSNGQSTNEDNTMVATESNHEEISDNYSSNSEQNGENSEVTEAVEENNTVIKESEMAEESQQSENEVQQTTDEETQQVDEVSASSSSSSSSSPDVIMEETQQEHPPSPVDLVPKMAESAMYPSKVTDEDADASKFSNLLCNLEQIRNITKDISDCHKIVESRIWDEVLKQLKGSTENYNELMYSSEQSEINNYQDNTEYTTTTSLSSPSPIFEYLSGVSEDVSTSNNTNIQDTENIEEVEDSLTENDNHYLMLQDMVEKYEEELPATTEVSTTTTEEVTTTLPWTKPNKLWRRYTYNWKSVLPSNYQKDETIIVKVKKLRTSTTTTTSTTVRPHFFIDVENGEEDEEEDLAFHIFQFILP